MHLQSTQVYEYESTEHNGVLLELDPDGTLKQGILNPTTRPPLFHAREENVKAFRAAYAFMVIDIPKGNAVPHLFT